MIVNITPVPHETVSVGMVEGMSSTVGDGIASIRAGEGVAIVGEGVAVIGMGEGVAVISAGGGVAVLIWADVGVGLLLSV